MSRRVMLTITGPSCGGKTTLLNSLMTDFPDTFAKVRSDTTRPARPSEVDGDEYNFITEDVFRERREAGMYCQSVHFQGTVYYGTLTSHMNQLFAEGKCPIRVVEPGGVTQFREVCLGLGASVVSIYVDQHEQVLMRRWLDRVCDAHYYGERPASNDLDRYAMRMLKTLDEVRWIDDNIYDFYYDERLVAGNELKYALSRIANGNMSIGAIRAIAPRAA